MNLGFPIIVQADDGTSCGPVVVDVDEVDGDDRVHSVDTTEDLARLGMAVTQRVCGCGTALRPEESCG